MAASYLLNWAADVGFEAQALAVAVAAAAAAPATLWAGGVWVFAGYVLAVASQMSFKPLSRRYLASKSGAPGLAVGAVNATSNVGTCVGQLIIALVSV